MLNNINSTNTTNNSTVSLENYETTKYENFAESISKETTSNYIMPQIHSNANSDEWTIGRYMRRYFSGIYSEETEEAEKISEICEKLEKFIKEISFLCNEFNQATIMHELILKEKFETIFEKIAFTEQMQSELLKHQENANHLAENHSTFSTLPAKIQALKSKIQELKEEAAFRKELALLANQVVNYNVEKKLEGFKAINQRSLELLTTDHINKFPNCQPQFKKVDQFINDAINERAIAYVQTVINQDITPLEGELKALTTKISSLTYQIESNSTWTWLVNLYYKTDKAKLREELSIMEEEHQERLRLLKEKIDLISPELEALQTTISKSNKLFIDNTNKYLSPLNQYLNELKTDHKMEIKEKTSKDLLKEKFHRRKTAYKEMIEKQNLAEFERFRKEIDELK
jgi:hypothetical protein